MRRPYIIFADVRLAALHLGFATTLQLPAVHLLSGLLRTQPCGCPFGQEVAMVHDHIVGTAPTACHTDAVQLQAD